MTRLLFNILTSSYYLLSHHVHIMISLHRYYINYIYHQEYLIYRYDSINCSVLDILSAMDDTNRSS